MILTILAGTAFAFSVSVDPPSVWTSVRPSSSASGTIIVENSGSSTINVKAYAQDWAFAKDRSKIFKRPGTTALSCSRWITLFPSTFSLDPGKSQQVSYSITAPETASGGYCSVIFFESRDADTGNTKTSNMILAGRIGTIVYLDIAGRSKKSASIINMSAPKTRKGKPITLGISLRNEGDTILSPEGNVIISDETSRVWAKMDINKFCILPGETLPLKTEWKAGLREGQYNVIVTLDYGADKVLSSLATLNVTN